MYRKDLFLSPFMKCYSSHTYSCGHFSVLHGNLLHECRLGVPITWLLHLAAQKAMKRKKSSENELCEGSSMSIYKNNHPALKAKTVIFLSCGIWDLNPYASRHKNLNLACLPIPSIPHIAKSVRQMLDKYKTLHFWSALPWLKILDFTPFLQ